MKVSFINLLVRNVQTGHEALQKENNTYASMINPMYDEKNKRLFHLKFKAQKRFLLNELITHIRFLFKL
jgi:hypothetical protein